METVLAGLGNRIFLLNNVHEDAPVVFQTRWAMSYLRFNAELAAVDAPGDPRTDPLEPLSVRPKKSQVTVRLCALAWVPHWRDPRDDVKPAWS